MLSVKFLCKVHADPQGMQHFGMISSSHGKAFFLAVIATTQKLLFFPISCTLATGVPQVFSLLLVGPSSVQYKFWVKPTFTNVMTHFNRWERRDAKWESGSDLAWFVLPLWSWVAAGKVNFAWFVTILAGTKETIAKEEFLFKFYIPFFSISPLPWFHNLSLVTIVFACSLWVAIFLIPKFV